jgi:lipid kinase YegS
VADFSHSRAAMSTEPRRYVMVVHGARAGLPALRHLVGWVRGRGHVVDVRVTWEAEDAGRFAREAAATGASAVVAVGGDGTVNEVLNGLADSHVPLGIIPVGTANDFARQAGIPLDVDHAMDVILRCKPARVDAIELNGRRFLNSSTAGVGAEATAETSAESKESLGALAYAITGARKLVDLAGTDAHFSAPDFDLRCRFIAFAVGNARRTGGGTAFTPRASVRDGLLDLCVIEELPRREAARLALRVKRGEHLDHPAVHYAQLPAVTVECGVDVTVNVDGETGTARRLVYAVRAGDVMLHLPDDSPLA